MKLSSLLVYHFIEKKYPVQSSYYFSPEPHLDYPVIYHSKKDFKEGLVYVIDQPDFQLPSHQLSHVLLVITGCKSSLSADDYPNLCILPENVHAAEVMAYLQEIFHTFNTWDSDLLTLSIGGASVQRLLDASAGIISNPIMVIGMDFRILAQHGTHFGLLNRSILGTNEETAVVVNALKNDPAYAAAYDRDGYFFFGGTEQTAPSLCVNIKKDDLTAYRVLISPGEIPIDDTFGFIAEHLADVIKHILDNRIVPEHTGPSYPLQQIFSTLLSDPRADYIEISRQLEENGWFAIHSYLCITIKTGPLDWKNLTIRSIAGYIENMIPFACAVEHRSDVVVFVNVSLCPFTLAQITQRLDAFLKQSQLNAGYSRIMHGHFNFQRQYVQSDLTIRTGRRIDPSASIYNFNDIALPYLLEQATRRLPGYMICHEKLLLLKYNDDAHHNQLYKTLRVYLENNASPVKAAQALFIHRSTLLYRLDKIKEVLASDLTDPDELLYLMLSYHILDLEERRENALPKPLTEN